MTVEAARSLTAGGFLGLAEADATIVGLVVGAVVIFAVVYLVQRARGKGDQR